MKFFFDNCIPYCLCDILRIAEEDVVHLQDIWHNNEYPNGIEDTVWIPYVGEKQWVVVSGDMHITTRPAEILALQKAKVVTYVAYRGFTELQIKPQVRWLFRSWEKIEEHLRNAAPGHVYEVRSDGKVVEKQLRQMSRHANQ